MVVMVPEDSVLNMLGCDGLVLGASYPQLPFAKPNPREECSASTHSGRGGKAGAPVRSHREAHRAIRESVEPTKKGKCAEKLTREAGKVKGSPAPHRR